MADEDDEEDGLADDDEEEGLAAEDEEGRLLELARGGSEGISGAVVK